jgi:hypothetical protein
VLLYVLQMVDLAIQIANSEVFKLIAFFYIMLVTVMFKPLHFTFSNRM